ncbi:MULTISPECIES: hypothetical protein [Flavobacterium]|uniref:DNA topoisomerase (ATP-hydrolyzing) n=1 Tax=Flavobacterium jumunjinense TaxID=998845 RepID=A0ABV5GNY8_9FLAO|nr:MULTISPECIES: hypothetical protein [Flavobacterium]
MEEQTIRPYKWRDHIRSRPAMYIGQLNFYGYKQIVEYLFEEILEDALENPVFEITFLPENSFTIQITNTDTKKMLIRLKKLQKTDDQLSNLGLALFIVLNANATITVHDLPSIVIFHKQDNSFGFAASTSQETEKSIILTAKLDQEIFTDLELVYDQINPFLRQFAYLNPSLKIISTDKTTEELQRNIFYYPKGVFQQLDYYISQQTYGESFMRVDIEAEINNYFYKIGISFSNLYPNKSLIKTYVGNLESYQGGSYNDGILDGLILAIKKAAEEKNIVIEINRKLVKEQFLIIAAVTGADFIFKGSIRRELGMPKLKKDVKELVYEETTNYFNLNPKVKEKIIYIFKKWFEYDFEN